MNKWISLPSLIVCVFLFACASAKVDSDSVQAKSQLPKPEVIYVQPFDSSKGLWEVDRDGEELAHFKKNASIELQRMMIERFPEIAPSEEAPEKLPAKGILISGEFVTIKQGSRALRMGIGFGAGATKVETRVRIYDLSKSSTEPAVTFLTTGGSNAQPGWIAGGWVAGGPNATGLQTDWERTAREIRNYLIDHAGH